MSRVSYSVNKKIYGNRAGDGAACSSYKWRGMKLLVMNGYEWLFTNIVCQQSTYNTKLIKQSIEFLSFLPKERLWSYLALSNEQFFKKKSSQNENKLLVLFD